jgi:UDP-N-acetylglucosamine--N-acetylmuramyl-(pentapeptide) pyrophosphoryl-undecaprenol N-acetylglucosamine transferase
VVSFAGTARGIESRVVPREGFELDLLRSGGLKGKSLAARVRGAVLVPVGLLDAWRIVGRRRPTLAIGVGGYSSGSIMLVAALRGIPTLVLEQNAVPGLTNRLLAPFVRAAAVSFESAARFFGSKAFVSGNPVRPEFVEPGRPLEEGANGQTSGQHGVRVLVLGGSQGAHAVNVAMVEAAPELATIRPRLRVTHQTGDRDVELVRAAYRQAGLEAAVEPFLFDMGERLRRADLIVCRAGATTLAEVAAVGRAAILIPLPTATDDHQRQNAEALAAVGGARVLLQAEASGAALAAAIRELALDADARERMGRAAHGRARPDAAKVIVDRALELAGQC